jgi:STE24 endopeptidase
MFGLLPLLFALTIAETSTHLQVPIAGLATWPALLMAVGASLGAWLVLGEVAARAIAVRGRRRWLGRWDLLAQAVILGWYAWACYGWGWAARTDLFTIALAPWILMQAAHWWTLTVAVRSISGHHWSRAGLVLQQFRFGVLPMLLILPFIDVGTLVANRYDLQTSWFAGPWGPLKAAYCAQAFMVVALILMPLALLRLWGVKRMPSGELQHLMLQACERMGVRVAGLMRWPMAGGRVYNAAVIGMVPRLRYVLFTDDLMRDLPAPQVMAVLGHELGHARHGHLWLYFLFANAALLLSFLLREPLAVLLVPGLGVLLPSLGIDLQGRRLAETAEVVSALAMMAVTWRLVFGYLSRACERQADLVGAELAGDPQVMGDALKSVAHLSGQGETEPSWRHYSIAERVAFLQAVRRRPELAAWHHHLVRMMRHSLILIIIALLLAASYLFDPRRELTTTGDPQAVMNAWIERDRDFGSAVVAADQGNHLPLATWLNRADEQTCQDFAVLILRQISTSIGRDQDGDLQFDDRPIYRLRHRLMPFRHISTGNAVLDLELDNSLAYGLVAGTPEPTAQDLAIAREILPTLVTRAAAKDVEHGIHDTIGCIHFVLGDYAQAVTSFETALKLFQADTTLTDFTWFTSESVRRQAGKVRVHLQALYSGRLDAARANAQRLATGVAANDPSMMPLPRDLGQPLPEPTAPAPVPAGRAVESTPGTTPP